MLRIFIRLGLGAAVIAAVAAWMITAPVPLPQTALADYEPDVANGRTMFLIGGCASCHAAEDAENEARLVLQGGLRLKTEFGTFVAPNISPDTTAGIGTWSELDFVNAMKRGLSPDDAHYYPAFPYGSYARMKLEDVRDLWAYLKDLPKSDRANEPHDIGFPFSIRRAVGFWKWLNLDDAPVIPAGTDARGRYLVEGPGHCGECHTPRDLMGGPLLDEWLAGAPNPEGKGTIPNLTPGGKGAGTWDAADIAEYLKSGFTPDYDTAGGSMVDVIANTSRLTDADRAAIAAYLKGVPAH